MANLQRIQIRIDMISDLIKEVEGLRPVSVPSFGQFSVEPSFSSDDIHKLQEDIKVWKAVTSEIVAEEVGDTNPYLFDFSSHWNAPQRNLTFKDGLKRKLERARTDLRILLSVAKEREGKDDCLDDVWGLIHPVIVNLTKKRVDDGFYADAVEAACKALNALVRGIVLNKTGEELDGAKLMQRACSVDNPVIRLTKGKSQSDQDTQQGYMQIFAGVMTGIRNPKAHDNESISREDAFRKLAMISMLMYKVDNKV